MKTARDSFYANRPSEGSNTRRGPSSGRLKSSEGSVTRYDQPRISGTVRLAIPITFMLLSPFLSPSPSFFRSLMFLSSQRLLLLHRDSPSRLYQVRSEQPDQKSLTSSSAGCNKKKPPTARSATRYIHRCNAHTRE